MSVTMPEVEPWDVPVTLRDLCLEMLRVHEVGASADAATVSGGALGSSRPRPARGQR